MVLINSANFKYSSISAGSMTKLWAIGAIILCSVFTACGQLFFKLGAMALPELLTNWQILAGFVSSGLGMVLFIFAMQGGEVSVVYPLLATSYIWTNLFAIFLLGEHVGLWKWVGVGGIILGISLIGFGSRRKHGN